MLPDRRRQTDGALLIAQDDLANVGQTLLEVGPGARLVDRLAQGLALQGHASPGTAGQVVPPPGTAPHHLAHVLLAHLGQGLDCGHTGVIAAQGQTWDNDNDWSVVTCLSLLTV